MTSRPARALATAFLAASLAGATQAQDKIRFAGNFELQHPSSVAMEKVFKPELAKRTNNQLQVDLFPAMQLGGAKENVDGVRAGTLLMTWVGRPTCRASCPSSRRSACRSSSRTARSRSGSWTARWG